jgi:hypothetical protein
MTGDRLRYLCGLMDAAYAAAAIHDHSKALGHAPIIGRNFRAQHEAKAERGRAILVANEATAKDVAAIFVRPTKKLTGMGLRR